MDGIGPVDPDPEVNTSDHYSEPERQSGPGRSAAWCGDRGIVMLLVPTVCRALVRLDTSAEEGSSRMGSVTRAGLV
jgi:hypothetical protein